MLSKHAFSPGLGSHDCWLMADKCLPVHSAFCNLGLTECTVREAKRVLPHLKRRFGLEAIRVSITWKNDGAYLDPGYWVSKILDGLRSGSGSSLLGDTQERAVQLTGKPFDGDSSGLWGKETMKLKRQTPVLLVPFIASTPPCNAGRLDRSSSNSTYTLCI